MSKSELSDLDQGIFSLFKFPSTSDIRSPISNTQFSFSFLSFNYKTSTPAWSYSLSYMYMYICTRHIHIYKQSLGTSFSKHTSLEQLNLNLLVEANAIRSESACIQLISGPLAGKESLWFGKNVYKLTRNTVIYQYIEGDLDLSGYKSSITETKGKFLQSNLILSSYFLFVLNDLLAVFLRNVDFSS